MRTYKANRTAWREKVLNALNMTYEVVNDVIIYKGKLDAKTLVEFLVTKRIELNIPCY